MVRQERDELDAIYEGLAADPAAFLTGNVDPEIQRDVARNLILEMDDESFDALVDDISDWARNPQARETEATRAENERLRREADTRREVQERRQVNRQAAQIAQAVDDMIPDDFDDSRADRFFRFALAELQTVMTKHKTTIEPAEVPELLGRLGVLEDFGLSTNGGSRASAVDRPSAGDSASRKGSADPAQGSEPTSEEIQGRMERRKQAAATAPAGAGSGAAEGLKPPPGQTYKERRNWLARRLGLPEKDEI